MGYAWAQTWKDSFPRSWLDRVEHDESFFYRYTLSFHWVMAQFTPAPTPFYPGNSAELLFAIGMLYTGFMVFSSFLGNVAARFTLMRKRASEIGDQEALVRQFFLQHGISRRLTQAI